MFLPRGGTLWPFPCCYPGTMSTASADLMPAVTIFVSSYVYPQWCFWKTLFPRSHPPLLAFTIFLSPLLYRSLILKGKGLIKKSHLGLCRPRSLTVHGPVRVSLLIIIYWKKQFLWWEFSGALIYVYSNISLVVFVCLLCYIHLAK